MLAYSEKTADGAVSATACRLHSVVLTAGSDAATVVLYDHPSAASGNKLITLKAAANTTVVFCPSSPIACDKGIYADVTGTAMAAYIYFS